MFTIRAPASARTAATIPSNIDAFFATTTVPGDGHTTDDCLAYSRLQSYHDLFYHSRNTRPGYQTRLLRLPDLLTPTLTVYTSTTTSSATSATLGIDANHES
ncbi:predicted protein [Plenodomus lingam JN3]|uniref:Predicted protein n=1 Tax=Leptosphaeria maculans (strain JN3 / isolate v23.1.3 / race Av1-4-5-6-7-8) TaxID=985895 RepID=E4ZS91_LEPMJ|nr:predicted protein [Plenodomus lingam JN3]CBX94271.1 predicted protein [Plenodomus lingam JN3]